MLLGLGPDDTPPCIPAFRQAGHRTRYLFSPAIPSKNTANVLPLANATKLGAASGLEPLRESRMRRTGRLPLHYCKTCWLYHIETH
jgi:hypothetical protein